MIIYIVIMVVASYLIGAVPFGYLIGRMYGIDIRKVGSGNIGATNVTRAVGPKAGKVCFLLDGSPKYMGPAALPGKRQTGWKSRKRQKSQRLWTSRAVLNAVTGFLPGPGECKIQDECSACLNV
jgi:glycerol-3-phosphate acyltransferase PlsY